MDFPSKLDQARNLSDLFELVKRAVEVVLGRTRAGLMLALADLGNHPQGFLGAFYPVASNVIVMNKVPLLRIQETNPGLYKPYAFYVLLHEYLHSLGFIDERVCREQSHRILETIFGAEHIVTHDSILPEPRFPGRGLAARGAASRVRPRLRPRIRFVHRVIAAQPGRRKETTNTPPRYAGLGAGRWRLRFGERPSQNSSGPSR